MSERGRNRYATWTPEMDRQIVKLRGEGLTLPEIAERVARTKDAVSGRLVKIKAWGLKPVAKPRVRDLGDPIASTEWPRVNDDDYVAKCLAGGGFRGLKFKPGPIFAYRQGQPVRIA